MTRFSHAPFLPTHWTLILHASADSPSAHAALDHLARTYWPPLYAYLRRDGHPPDRAADLTQSFFTSLLERHSLATLDPAKGKFRSFLLASLKHFLANEHAKNKTLKRGGGTNTFSLSPTDAESHFSATPLDHRTPDQLFDQQWALTLLNAVIDQLKSEFAAKHQLPLFTALQSSLTGQSPTTYAALAQTLDTTEAALQVAAHRLKKRYRDLLRDHIALTLPPNPSRADIDAEIHSLFTALGTPN